MVKNWLNLALGLAVAMTVTFGSPALAAAPEQTGAAPEVAGLEQSLFGTQYKNEPVEKRIQRLEETVFGEAQQGQPLPARIGRLQTVLAPTATPQQAAHPAPQQQPAYPQGAYQQSPQYANAQPQPGNNAYSSQQPAYGYQYQSAQPAPQGEPFNPGTEQYPAVTQIEQKVLGRSFQNEELATRLERVEVKVYGRVQQGDLVDRVDQLRLAILGDVGGGTQANRIPPYTPPPQSAYQSSTYSDPGYQYSQPSGAGAYGSGSSGTAYGAGNSSPDVASAITQVEKDVLRTTFPNDPVPARLTRLENKIFQSAAPAGMTEEERLQRIIAVASTDGSGVQAITPASAVKSTMKQVVPFLLMLLPLLL